jgi:hypothetical protein
VGTKVLVLHTSLLVIGMQDVAMTKRMLEQRREHLERGCSDVAPSTIWDREMVYATKMKNVVCYLDRMRCSHHGWPSAHEAAVVVL